MLSEKDIVKFHAVYWPIMLKALGLPLPDTTARPWLVAEGPVRR